MTTIERDGLGAVVSVLAGPLRVRRRDLDRHLEVLGAAFEETTIVPCAFGTVLQSRVAVEDELLAARRDELLALLERLDGRVQLNVRARYDEDAVLREIVETEPEIAALRRRSRELGRAAHFQNIRLGELVAAAFDGRRAHDAGRLLDRLAVEAEDVVLEAASGTLVLKASFLVAQSRSQRFDSVLETLAAEEAPRLTFESIGPLPPSAFAGLHSWA